MQLIDDVEKATKQRISEKWVYTHLKPELNEKLPRKDMLDILANYCRVNSWDAFVHSLSQTTVLKKAKFNRLKQWVFPLVSLVAIIGFFLWNFMQIEDSKKIKQENILMKDFYTGEEIKDPSLHLFVKKNGVLEPLDSTKNKALKPETEIVVESPFYLEAKVKKENKSTSIVLKPNDYAMMLKAFIQSDIKDWEARKEQLNTILSDDLEALIHLQDNLGIEYMNKEEFSEKLTLPTKVIKQWQILSLKQDSLQKITKIRIKQH